MKQFTLLGIISLICFMQTNVQAQQPASLPKDSIPISSLIETIEAGGSYRIYTDIDSLFKVATNTENISPILILKNALAGTPYNVSVYDNMIFILKEKILETRSPLLFAHSIQDTTNYEELSYTRMEKTEKATSENLVYAIGDPYTKEVKDKVVLKGKVTDSKTGEPLPGVSLILKDPHTAAITDKSGNFSIRMPRGHIQLDISGLNVKESRRQLMLYSDGELNIELVDKVHLLEEVVITTGKSDIVKSVELGVDKLQMSRIKNIPTILGEVDVLRAIQTLPGVKTVGEASTGFNVRGGATDQNLILLNNGIIYNPNHLFGFFTAFSSEMVKEAELYKSSIPAQYGGRISSVLDITGKEANKEKFTGSASLGLVTSNLNLEIPVVKNKTSVLLNGRTTYSDWILKQLPKKSGYNNGTAGFYDLGTVISHKINEKNYLSLYGYYSHDRFSFSDQDGYAYNNMNASVKWKRLHSEKLTGSYITGYDHYDYENTDTKNEAAAFKLSFDINQVFAQTDFIYDLNKHKVSFGLKSMLYFINSGNYEPVGAKSLVRYDQLQEDRALESALYIGDQWDITPKFSVNAGIRYSMFNALGPRDYLKYDPNVLPSEGSILDSLHAGDNDIFKTYHGPEFRFAARYLIGNNLSVKAGFNSMRQYIHKLSNTVIMSPTDTWKLSDANIRPQKGWQVATGLYYNSPQKEWESSIEVYYKKMDDYLDYRSGARLLMNHHIETDVINTEGYAYGVELALKKTIGKLNGWVSYSYSRTFLRQNNSLISNPVNDGNWYPTDYDKPHDFKLVGNYKITQRYSFSVNMDYSTGRPISVPAGRYYSQSLNSMLVYYTDRNSYRIPDYFRTDVSFNIEPSHHLTILMHSSISFGLYNVTGRRNAYSIYYVPEGGTIKGYQLSIFGTPIPFITYNIKF